jgi:hypothetical protein
MKARAAAASSLLVGLLAGVAGCAGGETSEGKPRSVGSQPPQPVSQVAPQTPIEVILPGEARVPEPATVRKGAATFHRGAKFPSPVAPRRPSARASTNATVTTTTIPG